MKTIEVELRGPIGSEEEKTFFEYVKENGTYKSSQKRLFFDLSQIIGINNRELDVRAKVTNGNVQIVVKKGLAGSVGRDEAEVNVKDKSLPETLHMLALLGYNKGVWGVRNIERYQVGNIEFAFQEVVSVVDASVYTKFYEAEIVTDESNVKNAEEDLRKELAGVGLAVFDRESWNEFEMKLNKEANGWFVFGETDISRFLN